MVDASAGVAAATGTDSSAAAAASDGEEEKPIAGTMLEHAPQLHWHSLTRFACTLRLRMAASASGKSAT